MLQINQSIMKVNGFILILPRYQLTLQNRTIKYQNSENSVLFMVRLTSTIYQRTNFNQSCADSEKYSKIRNEQQINL